MTRRRDADAFNGADETAFDHDASGAAGGSAPVETAVVLLKPEAGFPDGAVVWASAAVRARLVDAVAARPATPEEVALAEPRLGRLSA